jgi:hypothetical protein
MKVTITTCMTYFRLSIFKAGPTVLKNVSIMGNVQSNYYNTRFSETDLLNHYDVCRALLRKDICDNVSNFQFVIPFKSRNTPLSVKFVALRDTEVTQGLLMCPIKNVAVCGKNK